MAKKYIYLQRTLRDISHLNLEELQIVCDVCLSMRRAHQKLLKAKEFIDSKLQLEQLKLPMPEN